MPNARQISQMRHTMRRYTRYVHHYKGIIILLMFVFMIFYTIFLVTQPISITSQEHESRVKVNDEIPAVSQPESGLHRSSLEDLKGIVVEPHQSTPEDLAALPKEHLSEDLSALPKEHLSTPEDLASLPQEHLSTPEDLAQLSKEVHSTPEDLITEQKSTPQQQDQPGSSSTLTYSNAGGGLPSPNVPIIQSQQISLQDLEALPPMDTTGMPKPKGVILAVVHNYDWGDVTSNMMILEHNFNQKSQYPYVFLSVEPIENSVKKILSHLTAAKIEFGQIPFSEWTLPNWIVPNKLEASQKMLYNMKVPDSQDEQEYHRNRYLAGLLFRNELLKQYDYFWLWDPKAVLECQLSVDPFAFMAQNNIKFSFVFSQQQEGPPNQNLWQATLNYAAVNNLRPTWLDFLSADPLITKQQLLMDQPPSNQCEMGSGMILGDLRFFRSEEYQAYFQYLDQSGGFYYQFWRSSFVHTLAAGLFLPKDQVYFFNDMGYSTPGGNIHCPRHSSFANKCPCQSESLSTDSKGLQTKSCVVSWLNYGKQKN